VAERRTERKKIDGRKEESSERISAGRNCPSSNPKGGVTVDTNSPNARKKKVRRFIKWDPKDATKLA